MTLLELKNSVESLLEQNPEFANLPCIYSTDDEGNEYNMVNNFPTAAYIKNPQANRFLDMVGYWDEVGGDIKKEDINCIIIN